MTDRLGAEAIHAALAARRTTPPEWFSGDLPGVIGRRIEYHARIGSTSNRARELSASGEPEGTVVVADEQTSGRGRFDRAWHSPPGLGLYMSGILRPEAPAFEAPVFGLMGAVAAASALAETSPVPIRIKWPNDMVAESPGIGRRKIAGILAEGRTSLDSVRDVVIGIGINVNQQPSDFPPDIAATAVSLRILRSEPCDRVALAAAILTALDAWYTLWRRQGGAVVLDAYRLVALDLEGRRVRVTNHRGHTQDERPWIGTTAGITPLGALRVIPEDGGAEVEIRYGEVSRLREA
jgi:BirA family biotin operon repressor/biotin-[acetyl-CoA-carboxylase] ligase